MLENLPSPNEMNRVVPWTVPDGNPDDWFDVLEARHAGPGVGNRAEAAAIHMRMGGTWRPRAT